MGSEPVTQTESSDARWQRVQDAAAVGDAASPADLAFVETHEPTPQQRAEQQLIANLEDAAGRAPRASEADDELIEAVVTRAQPAANGRWIVGGAVAAVAAAIVAVVALQADPVPARSATPAPDPDQVAQAKPVEPVPLPEAGMAAFGASVPGETCMGSGGDRACGAPGASFSWGEGQGLDVIVESGQLRATSDTGPLRVRVPGGELTGSAADVRVLVEAGRITVVVLVGPITLDVGTEVHTLGSGAEKTVALPAESGVVAEAATTGPTARKAPPATELLGLAQSQRAGGDIRAAAGTYRRLLRAHADSPEAHAALPSLGHLELQLGRAAAALRRFDKYLVTGGPTAEEARRGRIRALRKLGRNGEERAAIADFLRRHPSSLHIDVLRTRAAELDG